MPKREKAPPNLRPSGDTSAVRPLVTHETVGSPGAENLLIGAENLEALSSLRERHSGKAELIYIDPPFNARSASAHYSDNLKSSQWRDMMRPRLESLRDFLAPSGLIFVHIDHRELAGLKLLMDEIYGARNFVSLVTVKVKDAAGVGQQSLIFDVCEYLLVYARDFKRAPRAGPGGEAVPVEWPVKGYRQALLDAGEPELIKTVSRSQVGEILIFRCSGYRIRKFPARNPGEDYLLNFERIFTDYNPSGGMIRQIRHHLPAGTLSFIEYVPRKGREAGRRARVYFLNRRILAWLRDIARVDSAGNVTRRERLINIWEVPNAQLFAEGGVDYRLGKKPEALLGKIISLATSPGDLVMDAFLGSGTTAAVAHKTGRRWIGIELENIVRTHALPRLRRVVKGLDRTGISRKTGWKGGGGFRFCGLSEK